MKIDYLIDPSVGPNLHQLKLLLRKTLLMKNPPHLQMGAHLEVNQPNPTQPQLFNSQISQLAPPNLSNGQCLKARNQQATMSKVHREPLNLGTTSLSQAFPPRWTPKILTGWRIYP